MKINYFIAMSISAILLNQTSQVNAQCDPTNLNVDWPKNFDNAGLDDIAWKSAPIDDDFDGIADNGFILVGSTIPFGASVRDAYAILLDANGDEVWDEPVHYGGDGDDVAYSVIQSSNHNIIICGQKYSNAKGGSFSNNVWLLELDLSDGSQIGEAEYGGGGSEIGYDIKEDPTTGVYVIAGKTGHVANGDLYLHNINAKGDYMGS